MPHPDRRRLALIQSAWANIQKHKRYRNSMIQRYQGYAVKYRGTVDSLDEWRRLAGPVLGDGRSILVQGED